MCRRLIYLFSFALVLSMFLGAARADIKTGLAGYWPLDEGTGTTTADASGNGHDGTFASGTPEWVDGKFDKALRFSGSNKVEIPDHADFHMQDAVSVALWAKPEDTQAGDAKLFIKQKSGEYPYSLQYSGTSGTIFATVYASARSDTTPKLANFPGQWAHLCFTYDGTAVILYKDGAEVARIAASGKIQQNSLSLSIGGRVGSSQTFRGVIDDVRLYNRALTPAEIQQVMQGAPQGPASRPSPATGAADVSREVVLNWKAGPYGGKHDVYLGTNAADVDKASTTADPAGVYKGRIDPNAYAVGRLEFSRTYYWRIDEVNAPPSSTIFKGPVWSFTTEPLAYPIENITATASSSAANKGPENTVNGSGLDANGLHGNVGDGTMWLSDATGPQPTWIQFEFDKIRKLHEMWVWNSNEGMESVIGMGFKEVVVEYSTDGVSFTTLGTYEFAQGTGMAGYAHNTTIDMAGVPAKYVRLTANSNWKGLLPQFGLSEVQFFYTPVNAGKPSPDSGAANVSPEVTLGWRAGREAAHHDVYIGADANALTLAGSVTQPAFDTASLDLALGGSYYWQVNEVNEAETPAVWQGDLWSFSTPEYLVVDDFESYNDIDPPNPESHRIFESWVDGYGIATNGALVGNDPPNPGYAETVTVHGDKQAMPLFYGNTGGAAYSEATRTFAAPQDWTRHGVKTLSLWFHGTAGNTGQLYVKINGVKIPYDGDAANLAGAAWQVWTIDLATVGNLQAVRTLAIGIDGNAAAGVLYVDDVRLYAYPRQLITPVQPDAAGLVAYYALDGNTNDSAGTSNGTVTGGLFAPGKVGQALSLNGSAYMDCGNPSRLDFGTGDWTVSAWIKTAMTGTGESNKGTIFGKGGDNTGGRRYALIVSETSEGVVSLICDDDVTKVVANSKSVINDDQWHFVVGQRTGTAIQIYIDGQMQGSNTVDVTYSLAGTSQHDAYIGAITNHSNGSLYKIFNGLIDDVRVYGRALSEGEIAGLAGITKPFDKPF